MTPKTATLLLGLMLCGAILWIALRESPAETADDVDGDRAEQPADIEAPLEAGPAALETRREQLGPLVVVIRSEVPRVLDGGHLLVRLRRADEGANAFIVTGGGEAKLFQQQTSWKISPELTQENSGLRLSFPRIPRGEWDVEVALRGALEGKATAPPEHVDVGNDGAEVLIELTDKPRGAFLRVTVVQGKRTIPDARVEVFADAMRVAYLSSVDPKDVETTFLHDVPADRDLTVKVTSYGGERLFGKLEPKQVRLAPGEERELVFEVPRGRPIRIQGISSVREKVGASLVLWRRDSEGLVPVDVMAGLRPKDGGWEGVLPPGAYRAMMTPHAHYARGIHEFDLEPGEDMAYVEVQVENEGVRAMFFIELSDGSRAVNVRFNVNRITDDPKDADFAGVRTDRHGRATSRPMLPGRYRLYFWRHKLAREVEINDDSNDFKLKLPPFPMDKAGPSIRGVVTYPDGSRANGIYVHAKPDGQDWEYTGRCDADGNFSIEGLQAGAYEVFAPKRLLDTVSFSRTSRRVTLGSTSTTLKLRLKR